jgi:hypothetical protein
MCAGDRFSQVNHHFCTSANTAKHPRNRAGCCTGCCKATPKPASMSPRWHQYRVTHPGRVRRQPLPPCWRQTMTRRTRRDRPPSSPNDANQPSISHSGPADWSRSSTVLEPARNRKSSSCSCTTTSSTGPGRPAALIRKQDTEKFVKCPYRTCPPFQRRRAEDLPGHQVVRLDGQWRLPVPEELSPPAIVAAYLACDARDSS